jgi:hypothetical protein
MPKRRNARSKARAQASPSPSVEEVEPEAQPAQSPVAEDGGSSPILDGGASPVLRDRDGLQENRDAALARQVQQELNASVRSRSPRGSPDRGPPSSGGSSGGDSADDSLGDDVGKGLRNWPKGGGVSLGSLSSGSGLSSRSSRSRRRRDRPRPVDGLIDFDSVYPTLMADVDNSGMNVRQFFYDFKTRYIAHKSQKRTREEFDMLAHLMTAIAAEDYRTMRRHVACRAYAIMCAYHEIDDPGKPQWHLANAFKPSAGVNPRLYLSAIKSAAMKAKTDKMAAKPGSKP